MSLTGEPIVILGAYRSGTSSVAGTLVHMGLFMGSEQALFPADEFNPDGHWELKDMMALHERLLMAFRMNYYVATWLPQNWQEMPFLGEMVRETRVLLNKHFAGHKHWGWKEPATSILLPLYQQALSAEQTSGRYLICVRHPRSVLASMLKRFASAPKESEKAGSHGFPGVEERMMGMCLSYMLSSLKHTQGTLRQVLCYERYLQEPWPYLERIANGLLTWQPRPDQMAAAVGSVKPQLSHSRFTPGDDLQGWPSLLARAYACSLRADLDQKGLNDGIFDAEIDDLWDEWLLTREMLQPVGMPAGHMGFSWQTPSGSAADKQDFVPSGRTQTVRCQISAPPGAVVQIDAYQAPCRIWIRKAVWRFANQERPASLSAGPDGVLEDLPGMKRLASFGSRSLLARAPSEPGPYEFEMEFFVQSGQLALASIIAQMGRRLDEQIRQAAAGASR